MTTTRHIDGFGITDPGRARESNEDQFLVAHLTKKMTVEETSLDIETGTCLSSGRVGGLFLVADGVAGRAAGEHASALAVEAVKNHVLHTMPWFFQLGVEPDRERLVASLRRALETSQRVVHAAGDRDARRHGMATTLTMAYVLWPHAYVVHVGDSRCYHVRGPRIEPITRDHTVAQNLKEEGVMSAEEAGRSPLSNVLWNTIGGDDDGVVADIHVVELRTGDALVLCTDGLTRHVPDEGIRDVVRQSGGARPITERLVRLANEAGGEDNITVVTALFPRDDGGADPLAPVDEPPGTTAKSRGGPPVPPTRVAGASGTSTRSETPDSPATEVSFR